ncbi:MAG: CopD family protein [Geothrix sp.]|uniref:CopD family protein n=1 Tax=Geothrix sp. TaxID=1962974 RepID=UPI003BAFA8CC
MTPFARELFVLLHLLGAITWFGGMWFAYFCLRPAAAKSLNPPERLPLWTATFEYFLRYITIAVVLIVISGFALLLQVGIRVAPVGWLVMAALGMVMTIVFGYVYISLFPRLRAHCLASAWPSAAIVMNEIRRLVAVNLILALCTVVAAVFSRY